MFGYIFLILCWAAHVFFIRGKEHQKQKAFEESLNRKNGFLVLIRNDVYEFEERGNFLINESTLASFNNRKELTQLLTDLESRFKKLNPSISENLIYIGTLDEILPQMKSVLKSASSANQWQLFNINK